MTLDGFVTEMGEGIYSRYAKMIKDIQVALLDDVCFSDLRLKRDVQTGALFFHRVPFFQFCFANNIDPASLQSEECIGDLLIAWYAEHIFQGGEPDPVQQQLIDEAKAESECPYDRFPIHGHA